MNDAPKLFVAIYTDAHVSTQLAKDLRERGYEAVSASDLGHADWKDIQHLTYAAEQQMAVLTFDKQFPEAAETFYEAGKEFWGIIISPAYGAKEYRTLLHWTLTMLDKVTADELRNAVVYLQQFQ